MVLKRGLATQQIAAVILVAMVVAKMSLATSYKYDKITQAWLEHSYEDTHSIPSDFTIFTMNIWGAPQDEGHPLFRFDERSLALIKLLNSKNPDFVLLQEVSPRWAKFLLAHPSIQDRYYVSEINPEVYVQYQDLGQLILSRVPFNAETLSLGGTFENTLSLAHCKIGEGQPLTIVTTQLSSGKERTQERIAQLSMIYAFLESRGNAIVMAGDFNFGDSWQENQKLNPLYVDVWKKLRPHDFGYTEDSEINRMRFLVKQAIKQERFDRIFSTGVEWDKIAIVGTKPISENTWVSDHFGLFGAAKLLNTFK